MITVDLMCFNDFQENTYILSSETGECLIIDPGCFTNNEQMELDSYLTSRKYIPKAIINTHGHIDHILGNQFCSEKYKIYCMAHSDSIPFFEQAQSYGSYFGIDVKQPDNPNHFLKENDEIALGTNVLKVIETPGHAAGSICLYCQKDKFLITGDVLFKGGIGRTDLPTGNYELLIKSIKEKLLILSDDTVIFPGHGGSSTIGVEKQSNPFF